MLATEHAQSLAAFRDKASETLDRINQTGEAEVLTVDGQARAVILSPKAYSDLICDAWFTRDIAMMRKAMKEFDEGKGRPVGAMSAEIRAKLLAMKAEQENDIGK